MLETGGEANFQVRPIENVSFNGSPPNADLLILDGQQRLTTLTQVLALKGVVKTHNDKGKPIQKWADRGSHRGWLSVGGQVVAQGATD
ncbi:MAG TPA: hypothetical protein P5330_10445 [Candidatus Competibacteraceae bacterium]|nr:hypothetical protein [Candidatus Competibacteraceae bacterium]